MRSGHPPPYNDFSNWSSRISDYHLKAIAHSRYFASQNKEKISSFANVSSPADLYDLIPCF